MLSRAQILRFSPGKLRKSPVANPSSILSIPTTASLDPELSSPEYTNTILRQRGDNDPPLEKWPMESRSTYIISQFPDPDPQPLTTTHPPTLHNLTSLHPTFQVPDSLHQIFLLSPSVPTSNPIRQNQYSVSSRPRPEQRDSIPPSLFSFLFMKREAKSLIS